MKNFILIVQFQQCTKYYSRGAGDTYQDYNSKSIDEFLENINHTQNAHDSGA